MTSASAKAHAVEGFRISFLPVLKRASGSLITPRFEFEPPYFEFQMPYFEVFVQRRSPGIGRRDADGMNRPERRHTSDTSSSEANTVPIRTIGCSGAELAPNPHAIDRSA
jgi:hypothetical protein